MLEFIWQYLVGPIIAEAIEEPAVWNEVAAVAGYNLYNTVLWAAIAVTILAATLKLFERHSIEFTPNNALKLAPLILLAGVLRFLQDAINLPLAAEIALITPIIYMWIGLIGIGLVYLDNFYQNVFRYSNFVFGSLTILLLAYIALLGINFVVIAAVTVSAAILAGLYYYLFEDSRYGRLVLVLAVFSQYFEGFASTYGLTQGFEQRQVLTQFFTNIFGLPGFTALKTVILAGSIYIYFDLDEMYQALLLVALYSIGLATGTRVLLRAATGI